MRRPAAWRTVPLALLAAVLCAGCGGAKAPEPTPTPHADLDPALRAALPAAVKRRGELRVVTDASYAPASFFAPDGRTILGFEPDLGAALGRVLGLRVVFVNEEFTKVIPDVRSGRADAIMSALTDTRERERAVDFVSYFSAGTSIVVQRGNPEAVDDLGTLCGHDVAVEAGTIQLDLLRRAQRNCDGRPIAVRAFPTNADALLQLRTGRVAAVLNDYPPAAYLASDRRTRARFQLASTAQYEPGLYGIGIAKSAPGLRDALRGALERVVRSGEYAAVLRRWDVGEGAIRHVAVNPAAATT